MEMSETRLALLFKSVSARKLSTPGPEFILLPRNAIDGNSSDFVSFRFILFDDILRGIPLSRHPDSMNLLSN